MYRILFLSILWTASIFGQTQSSSFTVDLRGKWKFEVGDNKKYADPNFDDNSWSEIFVPSDWENEGFPGYDGYAWYRTAFTLPVSVRGKHVILRLGYVDDVCGVYINGALIGEGGRFPPRYQTAYNIEHSFSIPNSLLKFDQPNIIAVRVYDDRLNGGIVKGKIGIIARDDAMRFVVKLPETWKFKTGNNMEWKSVETDDRQWEELIVPAPWDIQGYRDYDGFAWYRVAFEVPPSLPNEKLFLVLGKIDDIDEAYLNGEMIGHTGRIRRDGSTARIREEYREIRGYEIPPSLLQPGKKNVLAVRVFDQMFDGGIYEGPIGIVTKASLEQWLRSVNKESDRLEKPFRQFIDKFFD